MNNYITQLLKENYLFNKANIAVDLNKFLSGESNILLITGFSGSGKSTLGKKLAEKYKCEYISDDDLWKIGSIKNAKTQNLKLKQFDKYVFNILKSKRRIIFEGVALIILYRYYCVKNKDEIFRNLLMNKPIIFLGKSILTSSFMASMRDSSDGELNYFERIFSAFPKLFIQKLMFNTRENPNIWLEKFKKERILMSNDIIKFNNETSIYL